MSGHFILSLFTLHSILTQAGGNDQEQYALSLLYGLNITMVKVSILLMMHRLFVPSIWHVTFVILILIGGFQICWCITFLVVNAFQCKPVQIFWDLGSGHCINNRTAIIVLGITNVTADVVILILPIYIIWGLQMHVRQKLVLTGIFMIGAL